MDDNNFDKLIKNKVGEFDAVEFDPSALASFHHKMDAQYAAPWYVKYRSELFISVAAAVIAILLLWHQKRMGEQNMSLLKLELAKNQLTNDELLKRIDEIGKRSIGTDTVIIVEYRHVPDYNNLARQISLLQSRIAKIQSLSVVSPEAYQFDVNKKLVYLGKENELPLDVIADLKERGGLVKNGPYLFMTIDNDDLVAYDDPFFRKRKGLVDNYILPEYEFLIDTIEWSENQVTSKTDRKTFQYSVKKINELERHYQKGIGIEIGPVAEFYRTDHRVGEAARGLGGGVLVNFITSPNLGFETGAIFHSNQYDVSQEDLSKLSLPEVNPDLGEISGAEIASWYLETPLNLKYRTRIGQKNHLLMGAGVSALIYTKQKIELKYSLEVDNDRTVPVESLDQYKNIRADFGTVNLLAGISSRLNNGKRLETAFMYKRGLSKLGEEQAEPHYFGIRASYQFTVK